MAADHIDSQALLVAAATTDVSSRRLPALVDVAQLDLAPRLGTYRSAYERVVDGTETSVFLAGPDHWGAVGDRLGFEPVERRALERAHEEHLRRVGAATDRSEEFAHALDIRTAVVIETDAAIAVDDSTGSATGARAGLRGSF